MGFIIVLYQKDYYSFSTLCRQSTKTLDKAVLAKNLFLFAKNCAIFYTLHSKDFFNAARSIVEKSFIIEI